LFDAVIAGVSEAVVTFAVVVPISSQPLVPLRLRSMANSASVARMER